MTQQSTLSAERARELFSYDPETGELRRRVSRGATYRGKLVGSLHNRGYLVAMADGANYLVHRLAWLLVHGHWPDNMIDHRNGIRTDNRLSNLRDSSGSSNQENRRHARSDSKTGLLGVAAVGPRFRACIAVSGVQRYLGTFDTAQVAHQAYLTAKRKLHAGCTI